MNRLLCFFILFWAPAAWAQGPNGLDFDGTNDYVQSNCTGVSGSGARTVECWVKTTANCIPNAGGLQNTLVDWGTFVTAGRFTVNILWNNALRIETGGGGISGTTPINDGNWHHVAAVYDPAGGNNKFRLYVDGSLEAQGNIPVGINTGTSTKVRLGRRIDGVNYFDGAMDEVRIWSYAKTSSQIAALMNNEICWDAPGLLLYYSFNQGLAGGNNVGEITVYDQAGSFDGNLNGFSYTGNASNWVEGAPVTGAVFSTAEVTSCHAWTTSDGTTLMESGTYVEALESAAGCDSIVTLAFDYAPIIGDTAAISDCDVWITEGGQVLESTGLYTEALTTPDGCDSLVTWAFTRLESPESTIEMTTCGTYTDNAGIEHTASTSFVEVYPAANGCDSLVHVELTVLEDLETALDVTVCEGENAVGPDGTVYTEPGVYAAVLTAASGCDSTVVTTLSWAESDLDVVATADGWMATGVTNATWWTCDGLTEVGLDVVLGAVAPGLYYASTESEGCTFVTDCVEVLPNSVEEWELTPRMQVLPNPASNWVEVKWARAADQITLHSPLGAPVRSESVSPLRPGVTWSLPDLAAGWYILSVSFVDGSVARTTLRID